MTVKPSRSSACGAIQDGTCAFRSPLLCQRYRDEVVPHCGGECAPIYPRESTGEGVEVDVANVMNASAGAPVEQPKRVG